MKLYICLCCWLSPRGLDLQIVYNQEKYRRRLTSQSPVRASFPSQEEGKQSRAQNNDEVHKAKSWQQPDEIYLTDPNIKSRVWLAGQAEAVTLAKGSLIIIITLHFTSLSHRPHSISVFFSFSQHHYTRDVVSFPNQSHKKPPLSCSPSTPTTLKLSASAAAPLRENPAYETTQPVTQPNNWRLDSPRSLSCCHKFL